MFEMVVFLVMFTNGKDNQILSIFSTYEDAEQYQNSHINGMLGKHKYDPYARLALTAYYTIEAHTMTLRDDGRLDVWEDAINDILDDDDDLLSD